MSMAVLAKNHNALFINDALKVVLSYGYWFAESSPVFAGVNRLKEILILGNGGIYHKEKHTQDKQIQPLWGYRF